MRIISGKYKGRALKGKLPNGVRPTTDEARESIFNILSNAYDLSNTTFLDLFSGSGAMGLEAISRGAIVTYFIDKNPKVINYIKSNINFLEIDEKYEINHTDSIKFLNKIHNSFTIIFMDPPYKDKIIEHLISMILDNKVLDHDGLLVIEVPKYDNVIIPNVLSVYKEKISGTSKYIFLEFKNS